MNHKYLGFCSRFTFTFLYLLVIFTVGCPAQQTEEQALQSLREMTRDGKLPPENYAAAIENRFSRTRTGALARLLRARIRFENKDFNGAASLLDSNIFKQRTSVPDYALWLRGRALQEAGDHAAAMNVFSDLTKEYPDSIRVRSARILWANSAIGAGRAANVPDVLRDLIEDDQPDALLAAAKAHEVQGNQSEALRLYRRVYFYGAGSSSAAEAQAKLTSLGQPLTPQNGDELTARAGEFYEAKNYAEAAKAYLDLSESFPSALTPAVQLKRLITLANLKRMPEAQNAFNGIPTSAKEKEEAYYDLATGYAKARLWANARATADEMRQKFPAGRLTPKTFMEAGMAARDAKNAPEASYLLRTAALSFPNSVEVAQAQFELAWLEHDGKNFAASSQMFTEHLARYADKDTTNRGKAGYWAARDSERAGKVPEACALYDGVAYRYGANWYGYLAMQRIGALRAAGRCQSHPNTSSQVQKAVANLKTITVAPETSTDRELDRAEKSDELSTIGLFDWAIDELQEAKKTANNSPKINLALARHYRFKGNNVAALLALAKSYPDYAQMFPEEMGREEWAIFYPLINWTDIKNWARARNLDQYQVAGLIRQESVFDPRAKSPANAYGLMQLLVPTARSVAKKYGASTTTIFAETLFQPALNIELGTAYLRDQFNKFGRIEYVAAAYNAGPGRVPPWRASLPADIDEFVEAVPIKETKGYIQGVVRNSAQYRRLYDDNGNFKPNVGARPLRGEIDSKSREQLAQEFPDLYVSEDTGAE
jgi:soluble lytic murein transglycosylase